MMATARRRDVTGTDAASLLIEDSDRTPTWLTTAWPDATAPFFAAE
jgi:hypothetical protein